MPDLGENPDIFNPVNTTYTRVRVERTLKFVSRKLMDEYTALGGESMEALNIDPDVPMNRAHTMIIRGWAHSSDGILGYLAQWGMLECEVQVIHHIKVFVDGELAYEQEMAQ
jgi:hypothetical protein